MTPMRVPRPFRREPATAPPQRVAGFYTWPHLSLSRPRWRHAALACMFTGSGVSVLGSVGAALGLAELFVRSAHLLMFVLFGAMVVCMGQATVVVRPHRGILTYLDGRRVRVKFTPDPDRPRGVYVAQVKGSAVSAHGLAAIQVKTAQIHQILRVGDLMVPVSFLIDNGQPIRIPAPPS